MIREEQVSIRVSGLLQAVINSGVPASEWEQKTREAYAIHHRVCRLALGIKEMASNASSKTQ